MKGILASENDIIKLYTTNKINHQKNAYDYLEAFRLKNKCDKETKEISKILNIRKANLDRWFSHEHTPNAIKGIKQLKDMNLLPLRTSETKEFEQLIRTIGLRYADGCVYEQKRNNSFTAYLCFGVKNDANQFCKDAKDSWGLDITPHYGTNAYYVYLPSSLGRLMIHLGSPVGDKTLQLFRLPEWMFSISDSLKWNFLDGFYSGDGKSPQLKSCGTCAESLHISLSSEKSIAEKFSKGFMMDIWKLLESLNIEASKPKVAWSQPRISKDGTTTYPIDIRILTRKDNMIRFLENVKYRYRSGIKNRIENMIIALRK